MNSPAFSYLYKDVAALSCGNNTNQQPSDSAFTDSDNWLIPADVKTMWYRFSRRADKIRFFLTCDMLKMAIFIC